jgi:hypothetical protein
MKKNVLYKIVIILFSSTCIFFSGYFIRQYSESNSTYYSTNTYYLTNYISKDKPNFISVNLTNWIVKEKIVVVEMSTNDYDKLLQVLNQYSNYSQSDIQVNYSNKVLTLTHYLTTNKVKFDVPENRDQFENFISLGYSIHNKIYLSYDRSFFSTNDFQLGAGIYSEIPIAFLKISEYNIGIKINFGW